MTLEVRFLEGEAAPEDEVAPTEATSPSQEGPRAGRTENVGQGGAFVLCDGPAPAVGASVQMTLEDPTLHQPVEFRGEVRWVKDEPHEPAGFGVRFIEADRRAAAALSALVTAQSLVSRLDDHAAPSDDGDDAVDSGAPGSAP